MYTGVGCEATHHSTLNNMTSVHHSYKNMDNSTQKLDAFVNWLCGKNVQFPYFQYFREVAPPVGFEGETSRIAQKNGKNEPQTRYARCIECGNPIISDFDSLCGSCAK